MVVYYNLGEIDNAYDCFEICQKLLEEISGSCGDKQFWLQEQEFLNKYKTELSKTLQKRKTSILNNIAKAFAKEIYDRDSKKKNRLYQTPTSSQSKSYDDQEDLLIVDANIEDSD